MVTIDAFVPASAGEKEKHKHYHELMEIAGVGNKALIDLHGKPMIAHVLEALDASESIRSITIFGLQPEDIGIDLTKPVDFLQGGSTSFDTLRIATEHFKSKKEVPNYILNISSDIPLITSEMIDRAIAGVDFDSGLELFFNIVTSNDLYRLYPNAKKVAIKLREAPILTGDFHIFSPYVLEGREEALEAIMGNRKSVFGVIRVISFRYIFRYLLKRLTIDDISSRFKKLFDLDAAFLLSEFPETCIDLDYPTDIEKFKDWMGQGSRKLDSEKAYTIRTSAELREII